MDRPGGVLSEYIIGVEVLGRPAGYSPAEDSSVRTRAYELRHKLEKLYSSEAVNEQVQIVIPKGTYTPQYVKNPLGPLEVVREIPSPPVPGPPAIQVRRSRLSPSLLLAFALGGLLGSVLVFAWLKQGPTMPEPDPVLLEAWRPLIKSDFNVLLCVATPLHLVVGPEGHEAYGSQTYPAPPEAYPLFRQHRYLPGDSKLGMIFTDNVLGVGTMNAVVIAANTIKSLHAAYQILPERVATIGALRGRNAMLFGAPVDSDAIFRILQKTPLTVDYEPSVKEFVIRDRTNGHVSVPEKDAKGDFVNVYGLLTVINTPDSDRGSLGTVVFSGITSAGTQGAAEYFSSPRALRSLREIFAREGIQGFPAAYQVVVKCTFNNMLLISYEYNTHRILRKE
jgi:hypothetical protein